MIKTFKQASPKSLSENHGTEAVVVEGAMNPLNSVRGKSLDAELYGKVHRKFESLLNRKKVTVASLDHFTRWVFVTGTMAGIEIAVKGVK